jgi:DNA-binding Xre family transcriptional regulator
VNILKIIPNYRGLAIQLAKGEKNKNFLRSIGLSPGTVAKFNKKEWVALEVLARIAYHLECSLDDLVEFEYLED